MILFFAAGTVIAKNAQQPLDAHDALVYFTEARAFAQTPSLHTYVEMVNPTEPTAWVSGHTHTWLYSTFIAQALLATNGTELGPDHDQVARAIGQFNLLLLLLSMAALAWSVTGKNTLLTVAAVAATMLIPHMDYITIASSIDAFRILPLLLCAVLLVAGPRTGGGWIIVAVFIGIATAAHTLNLLFAPLLIVGRLSIGLSSDQWNSFRRTFLPAVTLTLVPTLVHYCYFWSQTGRFFGNGLQYFFYADSPLASVAKTSAMLSNAAPGVLEVFKHFLVNYGWGCTIVPFVAGVLAFAMVWRGRDTLFLAAIFLLALAGMLAGMIPGIPPALTRIFLGNIRYSLPVWILGVPLLFSMAHHLLRCVGRSWSSSSKLVGLLKITIAATVTYFGAHHVFQTWPISYSTNDVLQSGERFIALEVGRLLASNDNWMTDMNTVEYFSKRPVVFLYTPAGHEFIKARSSSDIQRLIAQQRIRVVALSNKNPDWWPRTALFKYLTEPGVATAHELIRWKLYVIKQPTIAAP